MEKHRVRVVNIAKHIIMQYDCHSALVAYISTTVQSTGVSPAELLMGGKMRTPLRVLAETLTPRWPDLQNYRQGSQIAVQTPLRQAQCSTLTTSHQERKSSENQSGQR